MYKLLSWSMVIITIEVIAFFYVKIFLEIKDNNYKAIYVQSSKGIAKNTNSFDVGHVNVRPHPYFGYTYADKGQEGINYAGFAEKHNFPYQAKGNEFVVGIFGGSVAKHFYFSGGERLKELLKTQSPLRDKKIVLLNFAVSAYKQPQQFNVATHYLDSIDLAINIDGYNEIVPRIKHKTSTYTPETATDFILPNYYELFFTYDKDTVLNLGKQYFFKDTVHRLGQEISRTQLLNKSSSLFVSWYYLDKYFGQQIHEDLTTASSPESVQSSLLQNIDQRIYIWKQYTYLQNEMCRIKKKQCYFFIQPNYHLKDSKPLAESEVINKWVEGSINYAYPKMEKYVAERTNESFQIHSLSQIFNEISEPLYIDAAHINKKGNIFMAEKIFEVLNRESKQY